MDIITGRAPPAALTWYPAIGAIIWLYKTLGRDHSV